MSLDPPIPQLPIGAQELEILALSAIVVGCMGATEESSRVIGQQALDQLMLLTENSAQVVRLGTLMLAIARGQANTTNPVGGDDGNSPSNELEDPSLS